MKIAAQLLLLVSAVVGLSFFVQQAAKANAQQGATAAAGALPQPAASEQFATVSGHIFRADTGAPLAKAIVRIQKVGVYPIDVQVRRTGPAGAYAFERLDSGTYQLIANAGGFAPAAYSQGQTTAFIAPNQESVHVAAGQALSQIDLSLPPCATGRCAIYPPGESIRPVPSKGWVISGTLVDPNGEPLDGSVEAIEEGHIPRSTPEYAMTDTQGRFQIAGTETDDMHLEVTAVGLEGSSYVTMYYPGALSEEGAQVFRVAPGAAFRNLRVVFKTVPVYTVNGKVEQVDSRAGGRYLVMISGGFTFFPGDGHFVVGLDKTFTIRELQPGHYTLRVWAANRQTLSGTVYYTPVGRFLGETDIEVTNSDVNVTIPLGAGP